MKVVWVQDFSPLTMGGGAQQTDREHIREGLRRGHDVSFVTPENANQPIDETAFVVLSNPSRFDPKRLSTMKNRYAVFHHDYLHLCRWRLFFPWTEKCAVNCPQTPLWRPVLEKAKLHVFLSPLHYRVHSDILGDAIEPHVLVPGTVNPDEFFDHGRERKGTCNVNGLLSFKGRKPILEYAKENPGETITFAGVNEKPDEPLPENCKFVGPISDVGGKMRDFYNQHEWYLELPDTPQPFNRTIAEAYLSGCKIKGNELLGALSWHWFSEGRKAVAEHLRNAPLEFWNAVEAVV